MNLPWFFSSEVSLKICLILLHSLWQVGLFASIARLIERLRPKQPVRHSHGVYVLALLISICALPITFTLLDTPSNPIDSAGRLRPQTPEVAAVEATVAYDAVSASDSPIAEQQLSTESFLSKSTPLSGNSPAVEADESWAGVWISVAPWLAAAYAAGVVLMFARLLRSIWCAERLRCLGLSISEGSTHALLVRLSQQWKLRVVPRLAIVEGVVVPKVVGLIKPTILIPASAVSGLSPDELEVIIAHELAHIRRHDMWIQLLQRIAEVVLFFNPALWLLNRRISALREYCCDEVACNSLKATSHEPQVRYAQTLLRVVELAPTLESEHSQVATLALSGRSPSELRRRVARLFGEPLNEPLRLSRGAVVSLSVGVLLMTSLLFWSAQAESLNEEPTSQTDHIVPGIGYREYRIGKSTLKDILGEDTAENRRKWNERGYTFEFYRGRKLKAITFHLPKFTTTEGIGPASSIKEMREAYPDAELTSGKNDKLKYGIWQAKGIEFWPNGKGVIAAVRVSMVEKPRSTEPIGTRPDLEFGQGIWNLPLKQFIPSNSEVKSVDFSFPSILPAVSRDDKATDPQDLLEASKAGHLYVPEKDVVVPINGVRMAPFRLGPLPSRFLEQQRVREGIKDLTLEEIVDRIDQWNDEHPGVDRHSLTPGQHYAAIDSTRRVVMLEARGKPGDLWVQFIPIGSIVAADEATSTTNLDSSSEWSGRGPQFLNNRFVICPVTTDLQRSLLSSPGDPLDRASVCVLVNAAAFAKLDEIDENSVDLAEFSSHVQALHQSENDVLRLRLIDPMNGDFTFEQREQRMEKLNKLLSPVIRQAGFGQVRVSRTFGVSGPPGQDFQWQEFIGQAQQAIRDRAPRHERVTDIGALRVGSVQTFLARQLSGADCVVDVVPIVRDTKGSRFVEDLLPIIRTAVENLHRTGGDKLLVRLRYSETAKKAIEEWTQWDNPDRKEFAKQLDFQRVSVSQSAIAQSEENITTPAADRPQEYTFPLSVSGRALNEKGEPIIGAKIYLAAYSPGYKRLAETTTNGQGDYRFRDIPLPIKRADTNQGRDGGGFEVFGIADGYALSWRPTKYLDPTRTVVGDTSPSKPPQDQKTTYGREEDISLDLTFGKSTGFRGRIVDDQGEPIANTKIAIRGCETERKQWNRDRTFYNLFQEYGLNSLNGRAIVPAEVKTRVSNEDGQFEFTGLPANYLWRLDVRPKGYSPRTVYAVTGESNFEALDVSKSYRGDFEVVFPRPRQVTFRVVYGDTGQPAQGVGVGATVTQAGFWKTTDENGLVTAPLADGTYDLGLSPRIGTPYLKSNQQITVSKESAREPIEVQLNPAAVVEIVVIDADTEEPLQGVDVWWEEMMTNGKPFRQIRWWRSWEVETRISHAEKPRTDSSGKMRVLFPPGKHRIGVAKKAFPLGYEPVEKDGKEIEMKAGEPVEVEFRLKRAVQPEVSNAKRSSSEANATREQTTDTVKTVARSDVADQSQPDNSMVVKLLDKEGQPIPDVRLRVYDGNVWGSNGKQKFKVESAVSDASGRASFPGLFERIPEKAGYWIAVSNKEGAKWSAPPRPLVGYGDVLTKLHDRNPLVRTEKKAGGLEISVTLREECPADIEIVDSTTGKRKHWGQLLFKDNRVEDWTVAAFTDYVGDPGGDDPSRLGLVFFTTLIPEMSDAQFMATREGFYPVEFKLNQKLTPNKKLVQRVELKPAPPIELTVLTPEGKPAVGAKLEYLGPNVRGSRGPVKPSDDRGKITLRYPELGRRARYRFKHPQGEVEVSAAKWLIGKSASDKAEVITATVQLEDSGTVRSNKSTQVRGEASTDETKPAVIAADANDPKSAGLFQGQVTGPDGKPFANAKIYIVPIVRWKATKAVGDVRAITDANGRFAFEAADMTYTAADGLPARRSGLIIATANGYGPDWMYTWGANQGTLVDHMTPRKGTPIDLQLGGPDVPIRGQLLDPDGKPLVNAHVKLSRAMVPWKRDLDSHLTDEEKQVYFMSGPDYTRSTYQPELIPGLNANTRTDKNGRFVLKGLGRERLARLIVSHPKVIDTYLDVMSREGEDFDASTEFLGGGGVNKRTIYASGFTMQLKTGVAIRGLVIDEKTSKPIAGMHVGPGLNQNSPLDPKLYPNVTDEEGRFVIAGLYPSSKGHNIVAVAGPGLPYRTAWVKIDGEKSHDNVVIRCHRGIPYRLKVVDDKGEPVDAKVEYADVDPNPYTEPIGQEEHYPVSKASRIAPGIYEGFVLPGPGVIRVKGINQRYRPAAVDPQAFFNGEQNDADPDKYGTTEIIKTVNRRHISGDHWYRQYSQFQQYDYDALVLVNPAPGSDTLELTARVVSDTRREVSVVDSDGKPVVDVTMMRGSRYRRATLRTSSFPLGRLHPDRAERVGFLKEDRQLIGYLSVLGDTNEPYTVRMQPWATVMGRLVDENGKPLARQQVAARSDAIVHYAGDKCNQDGRFRIEKLAPGYPVRSSIWRRRDLPTQTVFENVVLQPGEVRDLGDIQVRSWAVVDKQVNDSPGEEEAATVTSLKPTA